MTEINYTELNSKILEIVKREPVNFSWVMSPVAESMGMHYETDYAYIEYPCGWFKKLYLRFRVVNPHAAREHYAYVLTGVKLQYLFSSYEIPLNKIINHAVLTHRVTDYAASVLNKYKQKDEAISLKFNRMVNKLIAKMR